jgi:glycosyltransferase involved in cell wall biosynthesis
LKYEVIVPVYNGEDVLDACLESITTQENAVVGRDYSVLVIDDGSTDRTVEIAKRFPVEIISLGENRGRMVARMTGARNARADRLLFVDSRVTVAPGLIASLSNFDLNPAVIGVVESPRNGRKSVFERIFYLIRRKFYGPRNYPFQKEELVITADNFKRSPKGTTTLLIDRDLFLKLIPERIGKDVNDDTLLFHNLVFRERIGLLRSPGIRIEYDASRQFFPFLKWLYERGIRFADFYFAKGGYFHNHFLILLGLALGLFAAVFLLPAHLWLILLWVLWGFYLFSCVWLSETILDFPILFLGLPVILFVFGAGAIRFRIKSLLSIRSAKKIDKVRDWNGALPRSRL